MVCESCRGTGLIPFEKNGEIIPGAYLHCSCHPVYGDDPEPERYHAVEAADFDFPASASFRGYSFELSGQPDSGYTPPTPQLEAPPPKVIEHRHSNMSRQDYALLRDLQGQVKYLQDKLTEREKPRKPKPEGYRDIR